MLALRREFLCRRVLALVTAILGGLAAAVCWTCSALCATSASRRVGAASTLAWIMLLGLAILAVPLLLLTTLSELSTRVILLLATAGLSNVIGLAFEYRAFKHGKVGVVTAIASTEGMVATIIAITGGASVSVAVFFVLLLITTGIVITAIAPDPAGSTAPAFDGPRAVALSIPVPVLFGVSLFATGEIGPHVSMLWAILPARLVGGLLIGLPLIVRRELRITRTVFPLVLIAAIAEILGFAAYVWGSHKQIAIAAVLASEYAALAAAGAFLVFGERLGKRQIAGLGIVGLGVALLGALTG